jgi:hypothetical protein
VTVLVEVVVDDRVVVRTMDVVRYLVEETIVASAAMELLLSMKTAALTALVATAASVVLEEASTAAAVVAEEEVPEEDPKLLLAVADTPELTSTFSIVMTSPSMLVILTFTVVVPKPLAFSKKL